MEDHELHLTKNIKLAAFLRMKGIHPDRIKKFGYGKAIYGYSKSSMTPDAWDGLKSEFDKSDFIKYAQCLDAVLDLAH